MLVFFVSLFVRLPFFPVRDRENEMQRKRTQTGDPREKEVELAVSLFGLSRIGGVPRI